MRPTFRITADDTDITASIGGRLLSLRITDEAGQKSDALELQLDDRAGVIDLPATGAVLRVWLGYDVTGLVFMGSYTVDELDLESPPQMLTIRARAADFRKTLKETRSRPWHDTTLGDIVTTIAAEHDLTPQVSPDLAAITVAHVDQTDESDINLLTRLARQHGATAKAADGNLIFTATGKLTSVSGQALPMIEVGPADLTSWRATIPERGKYTAVTAHYHDTSTAMRTPVTSGTGKPTFALRRTYPDATQAMAAAASKLSNFERGEATISITMPGRPELAAESGLVVSGVRTGVDGTWTITRVEHDFSSGGYVCQVDGEVPTK